MPHIFELQTQRLLMRQWTNNDLAPFAQLNADPEVMAFYPDTLSKQQSDAMAQKIRSLISKRGWGFWAIELIDEKKFIGFVGLHKPTYDLPVNNCVEIGWRLARPYWGRGFASEAATAALELAFKQLNLSEVYSFASVNNARSQAVMERLHMVNTHNNFEHPIIPENHPLREHFLYRIDRTQWKQHQN